MDRRNEPRGNAIMRKRIQLAVTASLLWKPQTLDV